MALQDRLEIPSIRKSPLSEAFRNSGKSTHMISNKGSNRYECIDYLDHQSSCAIEAVDLQKNIVSEKQRRPILLLGPCRSATGGVSTHLNQLLSSELVLNYQLLHFQVGSEGRSESRLKRVFRVLHSSLALIYCCVRKSPEIVHINTSMDPKGYWRDLIYLGIAKFLKKKIVYQVHGGKLPQEFFRGSALLTRFLQKTLRMPDAIVLLTQEALLAYRGFVPGARIEFLPNAIDASDLAMNDGVRDSASSLHLVYIGRLVKDKGLFEAIEAVRILMDQGHEVRLSIAGSGPDEGELRVRVKAIGIASLVDFLGPRLGAEKNMLWRSGHIFVFPTYYKEGLPYALLEAMASGAVPVTSRVGAMSDVLEDGVHGLFVEVRDPVALAAAIARLDDDRTLLARMANQARDRVLKHYSIERLAGDFRRVYESLLTVG